MCCFFYRWEYIAEFNAKIFKITMNFYNYSEIIAIQLTSYLNSKPVNWNFVNNRLTVRLSGFGSQPYLVGMTGEDCTSVSDYIFTDFGITSLLHRRRRVRPWPDHFSVVKRKLAEPAYSIQTVQYIAHMHDELTGQCRFYITPW